MESDFSSSSNMGNYFEPLVQIKWKTRELPSDMIMEILSWLPAKYLLRFKCVCKVWCDLIQDRHFISLHLSRGSPLFLHDKDKSILGDKYSIIKSFSGLLLTQDFTTHKYHVLNPATRQILHLPDHQNGCMHHDNFFEMVALNSCTHECKLVSSYCVPSNIGVNYIVSEILTVGIDDHWRPMRYQRPREHGVVVKNCFLISEVGYHIVNVVRSKKDWDLKVFSFNIWKESHVANTLPRGTFSNLSRIFMFLWDNCLAVSEIAEEALHVMLLEDHRGELRWSKRKTIVHLRFLREKLYPKENLVPVEATSNDLWFHLEKKIKFCYDLKTGRIKETLDLLEKPKKTEEYRPSLVALKGMVPEANH